MTLPPVSKQKPTRSKFYFCNNATLAISNTRKNTDKKFSYIEAFLTIDEIKNHKQELKYLRGSTDKISLNQLSIFYSTIKSNKNYKPFFKKRIRDNINLIHYNFYSKVSLILLIYFVGYKVKNWLKK